MFKKVIVSHLGQLTQDTRTVGDTIKYRIYYDRTEREVIISDPLNRALSHVVVFNGGHYDPITHTITWNLPGGIRKRSAFVEFQAVVGESELIRNQAYLKGFGRRAIVSNVVETRVLPQPALGWIPLINGAALGEPPRVSMKDTTTSAATIRFDIPGLYVYEEKVDGVAYQHLIIPGWSGLTDVGKPSLPTIGTAIEVPFDVKFTPEIVIAETAVLEGYNVYPVQPPQVSVPSAPATFTLDKPTYLAAVGYPATPTLAAAQDAAVIRDHRVLFFRVCPVQYNSVTRTLTAYFTLEIRVNFDHPAQIRRAAKRLESRAFEELLQATVLNYRDPERSDQVSSPSSGGGGVEGCDYLIIVPDAFFTENSAADPIAQLASWKQRKGLKTRIVKVGQINNGTTSAGLHTFIRDAYTTWDPVPSYILLIGDSDHIPAVAGLHHPLEKEPKYGYQPQINTDLYLATLSENDYIPSHLVGRLPVDSAQQVADVVQKILDYEKSPPATPANDGFYRNVTLMANFADVNGKPPLPSGAPDIDGREDRPWVAVAETIRNYLQSQNYIVEHLYSCDSGAPPVNPANPAQAPLFQDGTAVPADLQPVNYAWNPTTADVISAFDNGRFLMGYHSHGGPESWDLFANGNVAALQQIGLLPVVFSITCQTAWFDNEIDDQKWGGRPPGSECLGETLLRRPRAGAVGFVGMTRISYTNWEHYINFGMYKAIWPDFAPVPPWAASFNPSPGVTPPPLLRLGQILNYGKLYMLIAQGRGDTTRLEFEMGHLFGDPEMPIWTRAPGKLNVAHPEGIGSTGVQEFVVRVTNQAGGAAVHNATVVLTRNNQVTRIDEIIQWQQTGPDGVARFRLDNIGSGTVDITATARNFRPYQRAIAVEASGAELNRLDPPDGPDSVKIHVGGLNFQAGESIDLYFDGQLCAVTPVARSNGEFGQAVPNVDIDIPAGHAHGLFNIRACGRSSHRHAVRVFQVRDPQPVDLWTYAQGDSSTYWVNGLDGNPTWDSPDIQLYDQATGARVGSNNLVLGGRYVVEVRVRNKTSCVASNATIEFKWRDYGTGGPWNPFAVPSQTATIPADATGTTTTAVRCDFDPPGTGHICVKAVISHAEDTNPSNNEGQENLHIGVANSPAEVCFAVWNTTKYPAPVYLEVRQLIKRGQESEQKVWGSWIKHPDPQILNPGDRAEACVIVDPDAGGAPSGTQAHFVVTAFIGGEMIGGVDLLMTKK